MRRVLSHLDYSGGIASLERGITEGSWTSSYSLPSGSYGLCDSDPCCCARSSCLLGGSYCLPDSGPPDSGPPDRGPPDSGPRCSARSSRGCFLSLRGLDRVRARVMCQSKASVYPEDRYRRSPQVDDNFGGVPQPFRWWSMHWRANGSVCKHESRPRAWRRSTVEV